jgi:hypothetical protein
MATFRPSLLRYSASTSGTIIDRRASTEHRLSILSIILCEESTFSKDSGNLEKQKILVENLKKKLINIPIPSNSCPKDFKLFAPRYLTTFFEIWQKLFLNNNFWCLSYLIFKGTKVKLSKPSQF